MVVMEFSTPELDWINCLQFFYINLFQSVCQVIQSPTCASKLYHAFEMQTDSSGVCKANSGLVFENFQLLNPTV